MEPLFFELIAVLKQQNEIVQKMIAASKEHNSALRQADTEKINNAVQQLNKLALLMAKYDPQREELQVKLEKQLGLEKGATLSSLIKAAPADIKEQLKALQSKLQENFEQLKEINELNNLLTKRALQVNTALLKILNPTTAATYHGDGKVAGENRPASVLNKTV